MRRPRWHRQLSWRRIRRGVSATLVAAAITGSPAAYAAPPPAGPAEGEGGPTLRVVVEGERLSVDARDAPLADVLRAIAERAPLAVRIHSGGEVPVTASFANLPLEDGVRRLTRGHDVVLVYRPARVGTSGSDLLEVRVYAPSISAEARAREEARERAERRQAVRELVAEARQGRAAAVASLIAILGRDPDATIRRIAAVALGAVRQADARQALVAALADQDPLVRVQAVGGLARSNDEQTTWTLAETLERDPDARVRRAAASALTRRRGESARRALEAAARDPDRSVRSVAAYGLGWRQRQQGRY